MTDQDIKPGIGEARTRERRKRQWIYLAFGGFVGGVAGFFVGFFDQGEGNLFRGDWEQLSLDPTLSLVIAALFLFGLLVLPIYGFRMIDDFKREWNLIAFTAGALAVISGFPVWALLYAGGFAPAPHARATTWRMPMRDPAARTMRQRAVRPGTEAENDARATTMRCRRTAPR